MYSMFIINMLTWIKVLIKTLKYNNYYNLFTNLWKPYKCMYVQLHACL